VEKKTLLTVALMSALLFSGVAGTFQPAESQSVSRDIDITPEGTILDANPVTPIQQNGNVYTFTGNVLGRLDIQKSNIVVDGAGYSLIKGDLDFAINVGTGVDVPELVGVNSVTIMNLQIVGFNYGIALGGQNNVVQRVNLTGSQDYNGIPIWVSGSNHAIRECRITGNMGYGMLVHATATVISDNYIANNGKFGIHFYDRAVTLRNNVLDNNGGGPFYMDEMSIHNPGEPFQISSNDIDPSNMVDGKPVYYWANEHDKTVPSDAGYVVLDNCTNITVQGLSINRKSAGYFYSGYSGISLIRTANSTISTNSLNGTGIYISYSSQNILIANNNITYAGVHSWGDKISIVENSISSSKDSGISLGGRPANGIVTKNLLTECEKGIDLQQSSQNKITENRFVNCSIGINLFSSSSNVFTKNSFINNTQQASESHYSLQWPLETYYQSFDNNWDGNFWSDYNGTDANSDGIGDIPYIVYENNTDHSPLMAPFASVDIPATPSPPSLQSPSALDEVKDQESESEPFPTVPVAVASVVAVAVVGVVLLVYLKKRRH
jgi:parallel beta-helix repeat protein